MAAYAALVSLMNNMEQIRNHPRFSNSLDKKQIESLGKKVGLFLDFVENYNCHGDGKEAEDLERKIASAAHAAEDIIESHVVDLIVAGSAEKGPCFLLDLQKIIQDMDSIQEKVSKVKQEMRFKDPQPISSMAASLSRSPTTRKTTMVGFDGYLIQLLEGLTGQQSRREIIPIVGMGGIGKTTLARNVYENLLIVQHFDIRAWVTVSQEYNVKEILLETLSCLRKPTPEMDEKGEDQLGELLYRISSGEMDGISEDKLGEQLHKTLSGWRYLVILDDMWSIEAWYKIRFFFPENHNRSRIIVTTRLSEVANHLGSLELAVNFLDDDKSWNLFCEKAFAQEGCPPELEEIGKKIVKKCKGLPLAIVVIGGLLGKSSRTERYWKNVAQDISSILNLGEDNQCFNVLYLSYRHLPAYLKPCFLYLGIFPEDHEIRVSQLIKLWVAEGLLKPNEDQNLEKAAEGYIKDLVDRNLISTRSLGSNGRIKTCNIHDLLRDLSITIAKKEKFFCYPRALDTPRGTDWERRIIINESITGMVHQPWYHPPVFETQPASLTRSLICKGVLGLTKSRLLRVLFGVYIGFLDLDSTLQQVNLRFLADESSPGGIRWIRTYKIPSSISLLWNVQTLIVGYIYKVVAPSEIWEMPQLRHLEFHSISLPDPPPSDEQDDSVVLRNLQTLGRVWNFKCSEEACKRMANIKKLSLFYGDFSRESETGPCYCLYNVGRLNKLESLKLSFGIVPNRDDLLQNIMFPSSLQKLTLENCELHWNDLAIFSSLPHLEVLKLNYNSVLGSTWNSVEGEFLRLKFLGIYCCFDMTNWLADGSHFPVLEKLVLSKLWNLEEIPSGIGEIPTLERICVVDCSFAAAISAITILEELEALGNHYLQVQIEFLDKTKLEEFKQQVELEGFTSHNFQISNS